MDITKTIIPAAGLGTRFLPYTALVAKELLPIINKPALQLIVEEALQSSISNIILITSKGKEQLGDLFSPPVELEMLLEERGKKELLHDLRKIARSAHVTYIRQPEPLGLGHAIFMARQSIHKEYFGIMLPDDIMVNHGLPGLAQLIRIARQERGSVIAVQEVPDSEVSAYGIVAVKKQLSDDLFQISHLVEKPDPKVAPSKLAIVGRYVLSSKIFKSLEEVGGYAVGELQLTDAIAHMIKYQNERVFAYKIQGSRYDVGTPIGWMKTIVGMGLQDPTYKVQLEQYLRSLDLGVDKSQSHFNMNTLIHQYK